MISGWKLKRELKRLLTNGASFPAALSTWLFGSVFYDFTMRGRIITKVGCMPASSRRAVYLMFPAKGLLASHIRCLQYLAAKSIATTVVSNAPLSPEDKECILRMCHRYIERPNFGYDFGGYRDGVLSIGDDLDGLEQLVLLNDSSWFPITDAADWLDQVDALEVDFAAAASNYGFSRPDPENFRQSSIEYRTDHPNFHYCSYALSFSGRALRHPGFLRYWKNFPLTNSKKRTVRRGEIGLTQWAIKNGLSHGATLDPDTVTSRLFELDVRRLRQVAENLIVMNDSRLKQLQAKESPRISQMTKDELVSYVLMAAAHKGISYATADFNIFECGFQFLKKSPLWLEEDTSRKTLELLEKLDTPSSREALFEAKTLLEDSGAHRLASQV